MSVLSEEYGVLQDQARRGPMGDGKKIGASPTMEDGNRVEGQ